MRNLNDNIRRPYFSGRLACLTTSFVKVLTIVYYKNFYSVFHIILGQLNQVFWKGLREVSYFNLLIREILDMVSCSGPCTVKYFVPSRMDISQLSELVQCCMLAVNALCPYQGGFPHSKLCPVSHVLLQYISDLCFWFQIYVSNHLKAWIYSLILLFLRLDWKDLAVFQLYSTSSSSLTILMPHF